MKARIIEIFTKQITLIFLLAVGCCFPLAAQEKAQLSIETDPSTFVLEGYSLHLRFKPASCERLLLGVGAYALKFPDPLVDLNPDNEDEGWNVKIDYAYGLFAEFYFDEANKKWFVGEQISLQHFNVGRDEESGDTKFTNMLALTYFGYSWHPFKFPLYVKPWAGLGYTRKVDGSTMLNGDRFDVAPLFPFVTFHIGYTF